MSDGSSSGTLARAALMTATERSSGRTSLSEPLKARPMGVRAVDTMTASVTGCSSSSRVAGISGRLVTDDRMPSFAAFRCGLGLLGAVRARRSSPSSSTGRVVHAAADGPVQRVAHGRARLPVHGRARVWPGRVAAHLRSSPARPRWAERSERGCAAGAAAWPSAHAGRGVAGDLGAADLGARVEDRLLGRDGHRADALPRRRSGRRSSTGPPSQTSSAAYTLGSRAAAQRA